MGGESISISRSGTKYHGYTASKIFLSEMGFSEESQKHFFELCEYYGGYYDCEVILNAESRFLENHS